MNLENYIENKLKHAIMNFSPVTRYKLQNLGKTTK